MLSYVLQVIACSGILYGYYHFFLRNERFHQYNRFYLLFALFAGIFLPLLKVPIPVNAESTVSIPAIFISNGENITVTAGYNSVNYKTLLYGASLLLSLSLLIRLAMAVNKIVAIRNKSEEKRFQGFTLIKTDHPHSPFSFFKWMFWNKNTTLESDEGRHIFRHEMYHIRSRHSWDLLFIEIILCLFWFNPFFYLYRKEISVIQEFLADKHTTEGKDACGYAELLLLKAISHHKQALATPFFHNQLKRRIAMLTTSKKPVYQWGKKLLFIPFFLLIASVIIIRCKPADDKTVTEITKGSASISETQVTETNDSSNVQSTASPAANEKAVAGSSNEPVFRNKKGEIILGPEVFSKVDVDARYPGNWRGFLEKNLNPLVTVDNEAAPGSYTTIIQFVVNKEGDVSDVKALTKHGFGMEEEAIRVIKMSGKWQPAIVQGKQVKAYRKQPVTFQVSEQ